MKLLIAILLALGLVGCPIVDKTDKPDCVEDCEDCEDCEEFDDCYDCSECIKITPTPTVKAGEPTIVFKHIPKK